MANNSNNRLSPQTIEHKKITTYVNGNPGHRLGTGTQRWQGDLHVFNIRLKVFNATFKNSMYLKKKNPGQKVIIIHSFIIITVNIMATSNKAIPLPLKSAL
jgi:hypothetical protein